MKKFLIGFFLSFCFLLLNGFSQLSAHQRTDSTYFYPVSLFGSEAAYAYQLLTVKSSPARGNNHNIFWLEREEKEDDDFGTSGSNSMVTVLHFTKQHAFSYSRKTLSFYTYIPDVSSYRHAILQVFRI